MTEQIEINGELVVARSAEEKVLVREYGAEDLEFVDGRLRLKTEPAIWVAAEPLVQPKSASWNWIPWVVAASAISVGAAAWLL